MQPGEEKDMMLHQKLQLVQGELGGGSVSLRVRKYPAGKCDVLGEILSIGAGGKGLQVELSRGERGGL